MPTWQVGLLVFLAFDVLVVLVIINHVKKKKQGKPPGS